MNAQHSNQFFDMLFEDWDEPQPPDVSFTTDHYSAFSGGCTLRAVSEPDNALSEMLHILNDIGKEPSSWTAKQGEHLPSMPISMNPVLGDDTPEETGSFFFGNFVENNNVECQLECASSDEEVLDPFPLNQEIDSFRGGPTGPTLQSRRVFQRQPIVNHVKSEITEGKLKDDPITEFSFEPQTDIDLVEALNRERTHWEALKIKERTEFVTYQLSFLGKGACTVSPNRSGQSSLGFGKSLNYIKEGDESSFYSTEERNSFLQSEGPYRLANQSDFAEGRSSIDVDDFESVYSRTMLINKVPQQDKNELSEPFQLRWDEPRWSRSASVPCKPRRKPSQDGFYLCWHCQVPTFNSPLFEESKAHAAISKLPERPVQVDPDGPLCPDFPWEVLC
jgi:hypothetical protein